MCSMEERGERIFEVTQLLIPTHAHFHWLKFIKNI